MSTDDVVVGAGHWQTQDPKALVNGLPLGPKGVKVFLDVIHQPDTFIWRPTVDMSYLEDCLMSYVAWPAHKVVFENITDATGQKSPFPNSASTEQISRGKSAETGHQSAATGHHSAATGSKSLVDTSPATGPKISFAATFSKSPVEKSPSTVAKSPLRKIQLSSQSPIRRSPVNVLD